MGVSRPKSWKTVRPASETTVTPEDLADGEGYVQDDDGAGLPVLGGILLPVVQQLGQDHQVVVVHPQYVVPVPTLTEAKTSNISTQK